MIKIFVKLYIIIFINVNISVVTTHYLCGKVELFIYLKILIFFIYSNFYTSPYYTKLYLNCGFYQFYTYDTL